MGGKPRAFLFRDAQGSVRQAAFVLVPGYLRPAAPFPVVKGQPTWGQCSVTSFLVQDIYGGKVYGVPLPEGGVHCYNDMNGCVFDLTSEQFGNQKLCYEGNAEQSREKHFADQDKYARYCLLREKISTNGQQAAGNRQ